MRGHGAAEARSRRGQARGATTHRRQISFAVPDLLRSGRPAYAWGQIGPGDPDLSPMGCRAGGRPGTRDKPVLRPRVWRENHVGPGTRATAGAPSPVWHAYPG